MFFKVLVFALVAVATAQHSHHATSYSSVSNYNNHVSHDYHHAASVHVAHVAPVVHHAIPVIHHVAPVVHHVAPVLLKSVHHEVEHHSHPKYQFKYGVKDTHTHDIKEQEESRDGDVVKGHYSLLQPDGRTRIVHYTADKHNGFQAKVEYSGHAAHPEVQHKAVVPIVHKLLAAPVYYH